MVHHVIKQEKDSNFQEHIIKELQQEVISNVQNIRTISISKLKSNQDMAMCL